jgi:hypothetical protein
LFPLNFGAERISTDRRTLFHSNAGGLQVLQIWNDPAVVLGLRLADGAIINSMKRSLKTIQVTTQNNFYRI